jgi:hypothetical protein
MCESITEGRIAMTPESLKQLWAKAADMDPTLRLRRGALARLACKRIRSTRYSRARLFDRMSKGKVSLFHDVPVRLKGDNGRKTREILIDAMRRGFDRSVRARVQGGRGTGHTYVSIDTLLDRWESNRHVVSTTDLHFRDTAFEAYLNAEVLSDFNLLCTDRRNILPLEMMTLVVSSAGNVTDSHSDDSDGSNHSFIGTKLWLAWDRAEGRVAGLEDVTHDDVRDTAAFDMRSYLSLPSARWWLVSAGKTLFLPGDMAHKVVTLEPYIGFGSFHVALPAYFRTLTRWILHDTTDVTQPFLRLINAATIKQLTRLKRAGRGLQRQWGFDRLPQAYRLWSMQPLQERDKVLRHAVFRSFVNAAF